MAAVAEDPEVNPRANDSAQNLSSIGPGEFRTRYAGPLESVNRGDHRFSPQALVKMKVWLAALFFAGTTLCPAVPLVVTVPALQGITGSCAVPVSMAADLSRLSLPSTKAHQLVLTNVEPSKSAESLPVQFQPDAPGSARGRLFWMLPAGTGGRKQFVLTERLAPGDPVMQVRQDDATGRWNITDAGRPVLGYNYQTNGPGDLLAKIAPGNLKYARPRSDYIHPLHGLNGAVLTTDWPVDHPHHRGIYWAWPEVDYQSQRGDLHALQRVFARPTGNCVGQSGPVFAQVEAENLWRWDDAEPIVRERVPIRAWRADATGRFIDLEFHFTALKDDVAIARRETKLYGGLNIRLARAADQQILLHTDPATARPCAAWAELFGTLAGEPGSVGLALFQHPANPDYPGDWIKFPEINWLQPCFPAAGTRYVLKKDQPLVLQFRLWIHGGKTSEAELAAIWSDCANSPKPAIGK